jgi:hypothetical protein
MGLLEDALRHTFAAQVNNPPVADNPAERAITQAVSVRRLRTAIAVTAATLGVILASAGVVAVGDSADGGLEPAAGPPADTMTHVPLRLDVLVGNRIVLAAGGIVRLPDLPPILSVWRIMDGWLVQTISNDHRPGVWFVSLTGTAHQLVTSARVVVGKPGVGPPQVAWGEAGTVSVAKVVDGHLTDTLSTTGTGDLLPVAITNGGVVLGEDVRTDHYEMWFPAQGRYRPGPVGTQFIVGPNGDGSRLLGFIGQQSSCLVLIQPVDLTTVAFRCDLDLRPDARLSPSPDGQWLVTLSPNGVDLYPFDRIWASPGPVANWPILASAVTWLPDGSFVVVDGFRIIHLQPKHPDEQEVTEMVAASDERVRPITDLRL